MAQLVDPFVPARPRPIQLRKRPLPPPVRRTTPDKVGNDIVRQAEGSALLPHTPIAATERRHIPSPARQATHPVQQKAKARPAAKSHLERKWLYYVKLSLACLAMLAIGSLAQIAIAGEIAIGIYAIWAIITKVPSRTTFLLALGTFGAILLLLFIKPDQVLMKNFATYAFLFLLTGTASLLREARD